MCIRDRYYVHRIGRTGRAGREGRAFSLAVGSEVYKMCIRDRDCTKVDRSAAYAARYVAKNIVAAGLADQCEIQLSYAIGVAHPTSIMVETEGTGKAVSYTHLAEQLQKTLHFSRICYNHNENKLGRMRGSFVLF